MSGINLSTSLTFFLRRFSDTKFETVSSLLLISNLSNEGPFNLSKSNLAPPLVSVWFIALKKLPFFSPVCVFRSSSDFLEKISISITSMFFHCLIFFNNGSFPFCVKFTYPKMAPAVEIQDLLNSPNASKDLVL